jgi:hypothetical protein
MEKFVIYCKSYINDLDRVVVLSESIKKHNKDNIPFYVSCPATDINAFKSKLPDFVNLITDEDIVGVTYTQSWHIQQVVKSQFWKYVKVKNYLCIDSDSYFIRDFYYDDFMVDDETPYTVIHQQKNLFQWTARYSKDLGFDPQLSFNETREKIGKELFGRTFKVNYDFGPNTVIWSSKVWQCLEDNYIKPNNLTFEQLIMHEASEFTWYGECLLAFRPIELYPIEPLFLVFHYPLQLKQFYEQGYTEHDISKCYLGLVMTSNWNAPLKY